MGRFGVLAGRPSRCRLWVVLAAVLAMVSPLGAVSSAQAAAVKASVSLSAPSSAETRAAFTLWGPGARRRPGARWWSSACRAGHGPRWVAPRSLRPGVWKTPSPRAGMLMPLLSVSWFMWSTVGMRRGSWVGEKEQ